MENAELQGNVFVRIPQGFHSVFVVLYQQLRMYTEITGKHFSEVEVPSQTSWGDQEVHVTFL